ncbi:DgyrCDS14419 [Dimorphilus gyrociliatus]|uniref:DgyrCDS14419 n=1 Tax=Dimorphilus gyrociliatus TaxID=2664684 RepID=A0A7I8WDH8_9ANNE|nr:DgyrCDS14419 [Dimorphilus gyrociliatus]
MSLIRPTIRSLMKISAINQSHVLVNIYSGNLPIHNGNIANVKCSYINNIYVESEIDNDAEKDVLLKTASHVKNKVINITYSTLNNYELKEFVENAGNCTQGMYLMANNTQSSRFYFTFLDGTTYKLKEANDGICKCIIDQPCANNPINECTDYGASANDQTYILEGNLAVLPKRLPLVQTSYGDLDAENEWAKHIIKPLKCINYIVKNIQVLSSINCTQNVQFLIDGDVNTCIEIDKSVSALHLRYYFNRKIKIISSLNDSLSAMIYTKLNGSKLELCKQTGDLNFVCEQKNSRELYIHIFTQLANSSKKVCEIEAEE